MHSLEEKEKICFEANSRLKENTWNVLQLQKLRERKSEKEQINETCWCYSSCSHTQRNTHVHICHQKIIFFYFHGLLDGKFDTIYHITYFWQCL